MNQDLPTSHNCYQFIACYIVDKKLATYSANKNGVKVSAISRIAVLHSEPQCTQPE